MEFLDPGQKPNTPDEMYETSAEPADASVKQKNVGWLDAAIKGLPSDNQSAQSYNPEYKPTLQEAIASTFTDFVRSGTRVGLELFDEDTKKARESLDNIRKYDPNTADEIEAQTIGKRLSGWQLAKKGVGAVGEGALTVLSAIPGVGAARTAGALAKAGEAARGVGTIKKVEQAAKIIDASKKATKVAQGVKKGIVAERATKLSLEAEKALSGLNSAEKVLAQNRALRTLYNSGTTGMIYGGLYGLHEFDGDLKEAVKSAAYGGVGGIALVGAGKVFGKAGGVAAKGVGKTLGTAGGYVSKAFGKIDDAMAKHLSDDVYYMFRGASNTLKKKVGEVGEVGNDFINKYNKVSDATKVALGKKQMEMIDLGLMEVPDYLKFAKGINNAGKNLTKDIFGKPVEETAFKLPKYIGSNKSLMFYYQDVIERRGAYAKDEVYNAAVASDEMLKYAVNEFNIANAIGNTPDELGRSVIKRSIEKGYVPQTTEVIPLKENLAKKIANAKTRAEREAIYASNNEEISQYIEYSVLHKKAFKTLEEGFNDYYNGYVKLVEGGSHNLWKNNPALKRMVASGEASSIDEAGAMIIKDMKYRKGSLTPRASSLDYARKVNLPYYDPFISRTLPKYIFDSSTRFSMAKEFGAGDEALKGMTKILQDELDHGKDSGKIAQTFEKMVRIITGQSRFDSKDHKVASFIKLLQVPKLAFASIYNLGQTVGTLMASDLGSTMYAISKAFSEKEVRTAIENGVMTNTYIREIFAYDMGGQQLADSFLKYTGFTASEMFNRAIASVASDRWAQKNLDRLISKNLQGLSGEKPDVIEGFRTVKSNVENEITMEGLKNKKKFIKEFEQKFPGEKLSTSIGSTALAEKRKELIETGAEKLTAKLQDVIDATEKDLLSETDEIGAESLYHLQSKIDALRIELKDVKPSTEKIKVQQPEVEYSEEETEISKDFVEALKKAKLENSIARLESKIAEAKAAGAGEKVVTMKEEAARTPETLEHYVTKTHQEIQNLQTAILDIQNEATEKIRLLDAIMDSYKISDTAVKSKNPDWNKYDEYMSKRKQELAPVTADILNGKPREYWALDDLGVDVEEAMTRGYLTKEEKAAAALKFVEITQFTPNSGTAPGLFNHPWGSVLTQFKTFSYYQARFVNKQIKDQFARQDYSRAFRNLLILGTVYPMTGEVLGDIRSLITQEKRPTKFFDRYMADVYSSAAWGAFADFQKSALAGNLFEFGAGPTVSQALRIVETFFQVPKNLADERADKSLKAFTKEFLNSTGVGRPISNIAFPSKSNTGKSTIQSLLDWGGD